MGNLEAIHKLKHLLPPLPYAVAALEPHIDAHTMMLHHDKHHASYVTNLNSALEDFPELQKRTASWLLLNLSKVPRRSERPSATTREGT